MPPVGFLTLFLGWNCQSWRPTAKPTCIWSSQN